MTVIPAPVPPHPVEPGLGAALAVSARAVDGCRTTGADLTAWLSDRRRAQSQRVTRLPFAALEGWEFAPGSGDLRHVSGGFFTIRGLRVRSDFGPVAAWEQPIIDQPEVGLLGIALRDFDGVPHLLMQAKSEPGNVNGVQLSPTVQATKSNYTRVHGGSAVPYLDCFRDAGPGSVVADVLQSEQGSWFLHKRNRNMIVRVGPEVEAADDFVWLTLGQVHSLLRLDDQVNMDARTVLSCLPSWDADQAGAGLHSDTDLRSWLTGRRAEHEMAVTPVGLAHIEEWRLGERALVHERGQHFRVVAVDVAAGRREVPAWSQPLVEPVGEGVVAVFLRRVAGVPHVLLRARAEAGLLARVELGPTVQCTPGNYTHLPTGTRPPYLAEVWDRCGDALYDVVLSEEGGRLLNARSRYLVIEVEDELPVVSDEFHWVSVPQVRELLRYSHHLTVQARTLVAALGTL